MNPATIDLISSVVLGVATLALVAVTAYYARQTKTLARLAEKQVQETQKLVRQAKEQMQEVQRPMLSLELQEEESGRDRIRSALQAEQGEFPGGLVWGFRNVGPGPALNVKFRIWNLLKDGVTEQEETVLAVGVPSGPHNLHLEKSAQADERRVTVTYEDVYQRTFESRRQLSLKRGTEETRLVVDPLVIKQIRG